MIVESEGTAHNDGPHLGRRALSRDLMVEGVLWRVFEKEVPLDRRSSPRRVLVFESEALSRFVRQFPADWRALPDDELYQLS